MRPLLYVETSSNLKKNANWATVHQAVRTVLGFFFVMLLWDVLCVKGVCLALFVCVYLDLLRCPLVQVDRFHSGDVDTQVAVDASTADTHEHPKVPWCPSRTWNGKERDIYALKLRWLKCIVEVLMCWLSRTAAEKSIQSLPSQTMQIQSFNIL